jgi:predicted ATPase/class 3 adenylate cyclase
VRRLPTGTVTFLFTDVAGSTRLLGELGAERYEEELGAHRDVIRRALDRHGGVEVDTQGDAFFCAFGSARDAVACAADVTEGLAGTRISVRMGLHTGEALVAGDHYVGMDVHRGARIGACGHGGQVVLSPSTVALLEPDSFPLHDLGEHRLKDLSAPVRLHQLGEERFPPLKTLHRTNLPVPATPFLGREAELRELAELSSVPGLRLLTLTGPGGTGKTRLALQLAAELAERFPEGMYWVTLAPLRDAELVPSAVAQALEVEERVDEPAVATIARAASGTTLLLLDNCEHVLDGVAAVVSPLLTQTAELVVLATSREPLGLAGERVVPVAPLAREDATALFRARAEAAGAGTELDAAVVGAVCARLDDLPLAVELAAARTAALPLATLLARLSQRLDLLRGPRDADERQRTLRATIAWSHDLLEPSEKVLFRRLAVFAGGAELEAAEAVCEADLDDLSSLVAKSLVRLGGTRYWMLETIREFAAAELEAAGEGGRLRDAHASWFAALARLEAPLSSRRAEWVERLEADRDNLRLAFAHGRARGSDDLPALGAALGALHRVRGRYAEADEVLRTAAATALPRDRVRLLTELSQVLVARAALGEAWTTSLEAERLLDADEARGDVWWNDRLAVKLAQAHLRYWQGETDALAAAIEELRPHVDAHATPFQRADFLHVRMQEALRRERYVLSAETEELAREVFRVASETGEWDARFQIGFALLWRGRLDEADEHLRIGREEARAIGDVLFETRCLVYRQIVRRKLGDVEEVQRLDAELAALDDDYGYGGLMAANRSWLAWREGDLDAVDRESSRALELWETSERTGPTVFQWTARFPLLAAELERGRTPAAAEHGVFLLEPSQQPLPEELAAAIRAGALAAAVELGRPLGYT